MMDIVQATYKCECKEMHCYIIVTTENGKAPERPPVCPYGENVGQVSGGDKPEWKKVGEVFAADKKNLYNLVV